MLNISPAGYRIGESQRLWSLWDIMRVYAQNYLNMGSKILDMTGHFSLLDGEKDPEKIKHLNEEFSRDLGKLLVLCQRLKLEVAASLLEPRLKELPKTEAEYNILIEAIYVELEKRVFIFIPPHRSEFYENNKLLAEKAKAAFPKADSELRKAGNAFAFGLSDACVHHCMGALEHGLHALAADVDVVFSVQNWQGVIDEIEKKIKEIAKGPGSGVEKKERLQFLGEAAKEFTYFKDGWRNHSAHNKVSYGEPQAQSVLTHVISFLEALSKRLSEDPLKEILA